MKTFAVFIGAMLVWPVVGWLVFMCLQTEDALNDTRDELDDLQDHVATEHTNGCAICAARRKRLTGE